MRLWWSCVGIATLCACLLPGGAQGQTPQVRVGIDVTAEGDLQAELKGLVSRELRALGDVVVTDTEPEYRLEIVGMETSTATGQRTGYAMSAIVTAPYHASLAKEYLEFLDINYVVVPEVVSYLDGAVAMRDHWVESGGINDLGTLCASLVARFDRATLAVWRRTTRN